MFDLPDPPTLTADVTIVAVGDRPVAVSGVFHFTRLILARGEDGALEPYFITHGTSQQTDPRPGERCKILYTVSGVGLPAGLEFAQGDFEGRYISQFTCRVAATDELSWQFHSGGIQ